jgi:hypothetical protein
MANVIDYTPPPTIREFIKDHKKGELTYTWIIGPVGCLPADSEFLTPRGWKRMDAYIPGDVVAVYDKSVGSVVFEQARYVKLPTTEPFIRFDSGSLEMELSPEHTVLYDDYRGIQRVASAAECAAAPSRRTIPTTFSLERPDAPISDNEIRLRIMFSADGHIPRVGRQVVVSLRKERKKSRLRELLTASGIDWTETTYASRDIETVFRFVWETADKHLGFVWSLSSRQLRVVLDECMRWDGLNDHVEKRYYTTVREHADAIQFAAHACGFRATIKAIDDPRNSEWATLYTVQIRVSDNAKNRAMIRAETRITRRMSEDGFKYCFTTSTGFFVARCNGKIFVTGNSGKTTGLFFKLAYMASLQEPSKDGIRRTKAVIVRNTMPQLKDTTLASWGYWFKDGEAGKWNATDKTFLLRFGNVECEVLFRPLDTPDDVARVLSLEVNFAILDEFVQIHKEIVEALSARLGRYKLPDGTKPTVWGMWGSSNPSTEDNWWYDYLHDPATTKRMRVFDDEGAQIAYDEMTQARADDERNVHYYVQPSGLSEAAENLENLPGGRLYYENQIKGKPTAWVKQFVEAEWGFSISGKPVVGSFNPDLHIAKKQLIYNPQLPLVAGLDPGLAGSALIFGQRTHHGVLNVLGECIQVGYGAKRLADEIIRPYVRERFPNAQLILAPDPAANNRTQTDERTVVTILKQFWPCVTESNNRLPLRLEAIEHFTTRLTDMGQPTLQIDPKACPILVRALKGGWRYEMNTNKNVVRGADPEKNQYSHPGDGFGYLARYFHKLEQREIKQSPRGVFRPPVFKNTYAFR